jgi:uncharacterized membrane protein
MEKQSTKRWPNLPEDYGDGQRQFDMAFAAHSAVEPVAWFAAGASFYLALTLISWILAIPVGVSVYFVIVVPHRKRLNLARKALADDIAAFHEYLDKGK